MRPLFLGYDARGKPVRLKPDDRKIHMHVLGSSGSGKSRFLEWMIRGDLKNRQAFCLIDPHGELYDAVVAYSARHVLDREIVLLNLSEPESVVSFNPFRKSEAADISVQVERRVTATMHAWGVENADETPTLSRTLRLIYTVMIEQGLGLPQVEHLLNFGARDVRGFLIERLKSPFIRREWLELHDLKPKDWRDEILSAKNRLFKLITSGALKRFMGLSAASIDLRAIMDQGKILLVNLKQSEHLSHEAARTFGALLVNEFFEAAIQRESRAGRDPEPYYLYLDEFQNFVSLDICRMLAEVRKRGLFLVLAHQYFEQLDEDVTAAALNNCGIKAVFGGLSVTNARLMAEELFIGKLDAQKIKVCIYQTKFWPEYRRDKVYGKGSSTGSSHGTMQNTGAASFSGLASGQNFYTPDSWFSSTIQPSGSSAVTTSGSTSANSSGYSDSESYATSESEADIPIFFPVPFQELSSIQFHSMDEQLTELTAALKVQFQRHCFIQIRQQETQPMLVPFVEPVTTFIYNRENLDWYIQRQHNRQQALPATEIDRLLEEQETALLHEASLTSAISCTEVSEPAPIDAGISRPVDPHAPIWNREMSTTQVTVVEPQHRKRGPKPDTENHEKVVRTVSAYGDNWTSDENLAELCDELDEQGVPVPKTWGTRRDGQARSWRRALQHYPGLVIKAIKDRCKAAQQAANA
jgi:TraM recognition site of TraD and TraG/Helicase HerA, central domain